MSCQLNLANAHSFCHRVTSPHAGAGHKIDDRDDIIV
jgi:hypothetical protein